MGKSKLHKALITGIVFLALNTPVICFAFGAGTDPRGGFPLEPGTRGYNPDTVQIVTGEIESVELFSPKGEGDQEVGVVIRTDKEVISVQLGPPGYLDRLGVNFKPGDKIQVTGSRVIKDKKPYMFASEVRKGGQVIKLRDETGFPAWKSSRFP